MADTKKILEGLQIIVTDLAQQADGHAIQSKIFAAQGFSKLGEKYAEHAAEERGYVDKCIDRILDLGGELKNGAKKETPVYTDVVEWIKYDLQVSKDGLAWLKTLVEEARDDYTTFDFLKRAKAIGLPVSELITHRVPLQEINEALKTNLAMTGLKIAIVNVP